MWACVGFIPVGALVAWLAPLMVAGDPELGGMGGDSFGQSEAQVHVVAVAWLAINAFRAFRFQPAGSVLVLTLRLFNTLSGTGLVAVISLAVLSSEFDMKQSALLPVLCVLFGPGLLLAQAAFVVFAAISSRQTTPAEQRGDDAHGRAHPPRICASAVTSRSSARVLTQVFTLGSGLCRSGALHSSCD